MNDGVRQCPGVLLSVLHAIKALTTVVMASYQTIEKVPPLFSLSLPEVTTLVASFYSSPS